MSTSTLYIGPANPAGGAAMNTSASHNGPTNPGVMWP